MSTSDVRMERERDYEWWMIQSNRRVRSRRWIQDHSHMVSLTTRRILLMEIISTAWHITLIVLSLEISIVFNTGRYFLHVSFFQNIIPPCLPGFNIFPRLQSLDSDSNVSIIAFCIRSMLWFLWNRFNM